MKAAAFKRLLLSKQLYLHGLGHSDKSGALNKMIAVHNFHNAIEIALRAMLLHYEIRSEKKINIEFEVMLNEIDKHKTFKEKSVKLPYRQELRNLNQLRNLVQHDATEPSSAVMDDWRVFTRKFLEQVCQTYFALEFNGLSALDMIADKYLKELLRLSLWRIESNDFEKALRLAKMAFEWAGEVIYNFLPHETSLNLPREFGDLRKPFDRLMEISRRTEHHAALLSSGINLWDYKRFVSSTPDAFGFVWKRKPNRENTQWVHDFVVTTIVHWQTIGLDPSVPDWAKEEAQKIINEAKSLA